MKIHHNIWHILLGLGLIALVIACFLLFILLIFIGYNILFSFIMPISLIALYISLWILFTASMPKIAGSSKVLPRYAPVSLVWA